MTPYRARQVGYVTLGAFTIAVALILRAAAPGGFTPGEAFLLGILAAVGVLFSSLTVEVTADRVRVWFGPGWIRRTIPVREIASAAAIRVPWYVGWGIRWWGFWLYNVSGRQAVVLRRRDGRRFGIGTGDPDGLLAALSRSGIATETR